MLSKERPGNEEGRANESEPPFDYDSCLALAAFVHSPELGHLTLVPSPPRRARRQLLVNVDVVDLDPHVVQLPISYRDAQAEPLSSQESP